MKLKVINPDGVHCKEIKGLRELELALPSDWFGYAAFELIGHDGGEIDLIICADDRLIIVEIKDWNVPIKDCGATWEMPWGTKKSPVVLTGEKSRKVGSKLRRFLEPKYATPLVDYCVLFTGSSKRSDLKEDTREKVFELEFFKTIGKKGTFQKNFPNYSYIDIPRAKFKELLDEFFSGRRVGPLRRLYNGYRAEDDARYVHPQRIYSEYFAELDGVKGYKALLRKWNFEELGNIDPVYRAKENFEAIALRELHAIGYLNEKRPELADRNAFLEPIPNQALGGVTLNFFELYKLPPNLSRLKEALRRFGDGLIDEHRISIARLLLYHFSELHELQVAHRDVGEHCIWVHIPDKVSLSGFATSSFPEQKTVSQIRDTIRAGSERIPEELLKTNSDNFRKDVFLLGSVVHQILLGQKPGVVDDVPIWQEPPSPNFKPFWSWFERALEFDPSRRFPDAKAAFEDFQRCSKKTEVKDIGEDTFREFQKDFPPMPGQPGDEILRRDSGAVVFRRGDRLIKLWSDVKYRPGAAGDNLHLLEFLRRIQQLRVASLPSLQEILGFGVTSFGTFVELKWEEGCPLEVFDGESFDDESGLAFIRVLVQAVADLHRCKIYHGDLKPGNILQTESAGGRPPIIRLIDLVDFAPHGAERRSSAYLPPEGEEATTPGCDGFALRKIVTEFLLPSMPGVSSLQKGRITTILGDMLDPDGGIPDLKGASDELESPLASGDKAERGADEELVISMAGIDGELFMSPDDRGLPVTVARDHDNPKHFRVRVADPTLCLVLLVDAPQKAIIKIWRQPGTLIDFIQSLRWQEASLERPLRVLPSHANNFSTLESFLEESGLFVALERRYRRSLEAGSAEVQTNEVNDETIEDDEAGSFSSSLDAPFVDLPLNLLWESLLDAEASIVPVVVVTDEPVELQDSGVILLSVGEPSAPFDPQDDEPVQVETKNPAGEWRYFGNLDNRKCRQGRLAVIPKARGSFRPVIGTPLRLESRASRASYDKRLAAIQRILGRESVCSELIDYFSCTDSLNRAPARFASRLSELERYGLNPVQKEALETALKCSPLAMIQGPPGTGKTSVISAAVHYIATNYPTSKILVVSQSHEAIDHATDQIVKRFRKQGDKPSLVRVGRREAVSDNLISFHSESLQGEYRERFKLSLTQRILPLGRRLGLSDTFAQAFVVMRARLIPLLQQLGPVDSESGIEVDPTLRRHLENACRQLDSDFDFANAPIASVCGLMEQRLIERQGETDHQAINALRKAIDLALEWVQILEAPGKLDRYYVGSCQIVAGTCVGVGRWHLGLERETFDCVIIDEAARCGPGDLAVACQVAQQVILVGDHKQLPPFLEKDVVKRVARDLSCPPRQVERSDFQRLFGAPYADLAGRTLKTQYRMRGPIGKLVSECFYPETGGIEPGRSTSDECYSRLPSSISRHVTWVDSGDGGEERVRTSFVNRSEIDRIIEILEEIDHDQQLVEGMIQDAAAEGLPAAVGIIAAYKAQAEAIEERIWESTLSSKLQQTCKIGTVDSYQGKENPIVIFSPVRCNPHDEIGFTRSWERVNVSLSRARERLVIVGSWSFWENAGDCTPLGRVVSYLSGRLAASDQGYARILKNLESK